MIRFNSYPPICFATMSAVGRTISKRITFRTDKNGWCIPPAFEVVRLWVWLTVITILPQPKVGQDIVENILKFF